MADDYVTMTDSDGVEHRIPRSALNVDKPAEQNPPDMPDKKPEPAEKSRPETEDDYTIIQAADGSTYRIPRAMAEKGKQVVKPPTPVDEQEFYVHLANGDVPIVKGKDLPGVHGTNAPHGYYDNNGKPILIIGVYPVEG